MYSAFGVDHGSEINKALAVPHSNSMKAKNQVANQLRRVGAQQGGTVPKQNLKGVQISNWQRDLNKAGAQARRKFGNG